MGVAAGVPSGLGLLAQTFEAGSRLRTLAFVTFSCGAPLGGAVGFTMGSVLTQETALVFPFGFLVRASSD